MDLLIGLGVCALSVLVVGNYEAWYWALLGGPALFALCYGAFWGTYAVAKVNNHSDAFHGMLIGHLIAATGLATLGFLYYGVGYGAP